MIGMLHHVNEADLLVATHLADGVLGVLGRFTVAAQINDIDALPPLVGDARLVPVCAAQRRSLL